MLNTGPCSIVIMFVLITIGEAVEDQVPAEQDDGSYIAVIS